MTVSTAGDPPSATTSDDPVSFARLGWQLATLGACAQCDRRTSLCPVCAAALDELILEEHLQHGVDLFDQVTAWRDAGLLNASAALRLWSSIEHTTPGSDRRAADRPAVTTAASPTPAKATAADIPDLENLQPPRVRRSFRWRDLGESLLAERTLNTLLGLGAFLILASALVISLLNPTGLPLVPHLGVLAGTMSLFYVAGYVCYARMRLTRAGETLLAIAAAFVPLDVWIVGGADGLGWSRAEIWAIASAVALPVYGLSYALLPGRPFAWLAAIAGQSLLLSGLNFSGVPREWVACASVVLANVYILGSARLRSRRWAALGTAFFWLAQALTPAIMLVLLGTKLSGVAGGLVAEPVSEYAVGAAWWLGIGLYALSARLRSGLPFAALALWLAPIAYLLTLTKAPWPPTWYGIWFVALAGVYAFGARRPSNSSSRMHFTNVAVVLAVGGVMWAASAGVTWALFAATLADTLLALVVAAVRRSAHLGFVAVALFSTAFGLGLQLVHWPGWTGDQPWPWLLLAIGLTVAAEVHLHKTSENRRPVAALMSGRGSWHAVFAPGLFDAGCLSGLLAVVLSLWNASSVGLLGASTVLAAVGATAACLAWTRRSATFLYPTSVLIAAAVGIAMWATYPDSRMLAVGLSLAALGGAYGCLERQLFSGIGRSYRGPLWHTGLLLAALGPALAVYSIDAPHQWLVATLCAFLFAAALAFIRHPVWTYPPALWSLVGYELALRTLLPNPRPEYLLGALVLPACGALALAEFAAHHTPSPPQPSVFALGAVARTRWAVPPLFLAVFAFAVSMLGTVWDGGVGSAVAATYAVAVAAVAMRHGSLPGERWTALVLTVFAVTNPFDEARASSEWAPLIIAGTGVVLAALSVASMRSQRPAVHAWQVPLELTGVALAVLATAVAYTWILRGSPHTASATSALCAVLLLTVAYARRSRTWTYCGIAALVVAGLIELAAARVSQTQAYTLPIGLYAAVLAWLEWRTADRSRLKAPFEIAALFVLLGTTTLQGMGYLQAGLDRYAYDVALIIGGMAILAAGAILHWWRSLFAGAAAVVIAVLFLLAEPLAAVNTWYLIGSLGLVLMGGVVFLERRRQQIPAWFEDWRDRLETWA